MAVRNGNQRSDAKLSHERTGNRPLDQIVKASYLLSTIAYVFDSPKRKAALKICNKQLSWTIQSPPGRSKPWIIA